MKIALVIEHFDATRGGAEHLTVWLAGQLANRGHEIHVLCRDATPRRKSRHAASQGASHDAQTSAAAHGPSHADPADQPNPNVHIHPISRVKMRTGPGFRLFGRRARAWCRRHPIDVVHSMSVSWAGDIYHPHAGVYARMQAQAIASRNTPSSAEFKRIMLKLSAKQRALLALEQRAAGPPEGGGAWKIICISPMMAREFTEHYAAPAHRIMPLENPNMYDAPCPADAPSGAWLRDIYQLTSADRVALFVGHDFRRKGLEWAIRTIAATGDQWRLLVIGLGKVRDYVQLAESLGVQDRVKFIGPTSHMHAAYAAADALLLPTFYDSFGLVALEAMAHGRPVVSTEYLGAAYLVREHGAGVIVPTPRDVPAMAAALDALPRNGPGIQRLAAAARLAAQRMPATVYTDRLLELYDSFMKTGPDARRFNRF